MIFRPKKDRSKSIPVLNMNLKLKSFHDMKEDLLLKKSGIYDEIDKEDLEALVPILEYNQNNINRKILLMPYEQVV